MRIPDESQISCRKWCGPSIWNVFAENLQTKKIVPLRPRASVLSREVIISPDRPLSFQSTSLSEHLLYCVSPLSPFFFPTKPTQAQASKPRFLWPRLAGSAYTVVGLHIIISRKSFGNSGERFFWPSQKRLSTRVVKKGEF